MRQETPLCKFVANCAPNLRKISCISFCASEEGCTTLSQICRKLENDFWTIYANTPFSKAPFSKFLSMQQTTLRTCSCLRNTRAQYRLAALVTEHVGWTLSRYGRAMFEQRAVVSKHLQPLKGANAENLVCSQSGPKMPWQPET